MRYVQSPAIQASPCRRIKVDEERMTRHTADDLPPERTFPHASDSRGRGGLTGYTPKVWGQMHLIVPIAMASFAYGSLLGRYQLFPIRSSPAA